MAGYFDALKIVAIPALIAAFIYILIAFVIRPLARRHRDRYNQYVPVDAILDGTSAVRSQLVGTIIEFSFRLFQRRRRIIDVADDQDSHDGHDLAFGDEEGESMVGFDVSHRDQSVRGGNVELHSDARLSRDLEEGFKDDSEEETIDDRTVGARDTS